MAKVKIEKCEFWDYLPTELKRLRRKRVDTAEKNVLATLIFHYYENSEYRREHDGWFYASKSTTLVEETNMSPNTVRKALVNLALERMIFTRIGRNVPNVAENVQKLAKIVHYKFQPQVLDLLEVIDDFDENFMNTSKDKQVEINETSKDESSEVKISKEKVEGDVFSNLPF